MDKDVVATFVTENPNDRERQARLVQLLAMGVARLIEGAAVKPVVDLSADVRVTTTTARPGAGDES